jgi:hypothetical protein
MSIISAKKSQSRGIICHEADITVEAVITYILLLNSTSHLNFSNDLRLSSGLNLSPSDDDFPRMVRFQNFRGEPRSTGLVDCRSCVDDGFGRKSRLGERLIRLLAVANGLIVLASDRRRRTRTSVVSRAGQSDEQGFRHRRSR